MKQITFLSLIKIVALCSVASGQSVSHNLSAYLKNDGLIPYNRTISVAEKDPGNVIVISENKGEGIVWLKNVSFSEGIIEVDLHGQDVFQRSFLGVAFSGTDNETYEAIYFRPFNFFAKDSIRRVHAVQYISHPQYPWKKLRDSFPGVYEKEIEKAPQPNGWFHARIEIFGENVSVFVNDSNKPCLTVKRLNNVQKGKLGLWVGDGSGGEFAHLKTINRKK